MAAQLTFVFRKALSCRHKISFSGFCAWGLVPQYFQLWHERIATVARRVQYPQSSNRKRCRFAAYLQDHRVRNFKSVSAISKPSLVRTMISNRFRVSSVNL